MKKILFMLMVLLSLVSVTYAGMAPSILPASSYYQGQHDRSFNLGSEGTLDIHLEFAVYRDETQYGGTVNEAQIMQEWTGHTGDADYVYAYQVFSKQSSTAPLTYFALTGINPAAIADVQNDIGQADSLKNGAIQSEGIAPSGSYFNASVTKAIWEFDGGSIVQGEQSWFLFLYSDNDWIAGDMEIQPPADDDIPVPSVPEPATLALLACGTVLSLRCRKRG